VWCRGLVALVVAGASVLASGAGGVVLGRAAADLNGDQQVDVLDMQACVAALLARTGDPNAADVDGDGRTDIRDLQRIIEETGHEAPDPAVSSHVREWAAGVPSAVRLIGKSNQTTPAEFTLPAVVAARRIAPVSDPPPRRLYGGKMYRHLSGGTPHSPPDRV